MDAHNDSSSVSSAEVLAILEQENKQRKVTVLAGVQAITPNRVTYLNIFSDDALVSLPSSDVDVALRVDLDASAV